ncbi:MAG: TIM barrel protein [Planctomycetes bacterium]|nr:TIM barrel protein [Planctomycetota bacterium]
MKISIVSYSFHGLLQNEMINIYSYLESVRYRYDLDAADIWSGMIESLDEDYLKRVREALDERELGLANLCVDGAHLWEDDPEDREEHYKLGLRWLNAAEILGANTIRIDMGGSGEQLTDEQFEYIVKRYREYADRAQEGGYMVGPETHWGPSLTVEVQKAVYNAVDNPAYGILLHIGHWNGGPEEQNRGDEMAAPWAMHTHVAANIAADGPEDKMRMMREAGYDGYWGVEHHSAQNEYAEVEWQLAVVRRAAKRLQAGE